MNNLYVGLDITYDTTKQTPCDALNELIKKLESIEGVRVFDAHDDNLTDENGKELFDSFDDEDDEVECDSCEAKQFVKVSYNVDDSGVLHVYADNCLAAEISDCSGRTEDELKQFASDILSELGYDVGEESFYQEEQ